MKKVIPIIILTFLSAILIFYRFTDIPKYLAFDEVEFTKLALSLDNKPYISYSQLATGHSTLYFYILLASLKLFGITTSALRFPAAVFGILSVVMFYLIMKKVFQSVFAKASTDKQYFPFLLTFIFLSSRWFLNFARFSFEATFLLFLELVSIYFLISKKSLFISGLFAGLAFLSYTPGRIFFILPLIFMILSFPRRRESSDSGSPIRSGMTHVLCFLIPFLIIITPLTSYLLTNKDTRIDQQFFLKNHKMPIQEKLTGLWHNISSTALMFNIKGDVNGRHNYPLKPALNPILGILFIIGLAIIIKSSFVKTTADKQWNNRLFLIYFFISLFPAVMTYPWENPNMLRTFTALPSVVYFIGQGLSVIARSETTKQSLKFLRLPRSLWSLAMTVVIILFILLSSLYELRTYFKYQSTVFNQSFEIKLPLDKAIKVKLKS